MNPQTLDTIARFSTDQYSNTSRFNARVQIYRFTERPQDWFSWVAERITLKGRSRILDIGCGDAGLWRILGKTREPESHLVLCDLSSQMLKKASGHLDMKNIAFVLSYVNNAPFGSGVFDVVIANHMLYHTRSIDDALAEMSRIGASGCRYYSSTTSYDHFIELKQFVSDFDPRLSFFDQYVSVFNLENGQEILARRFGAVRRSVLSNHILISEVDPVLLWLASQYEGEQMAIFMARIHEIAEAIQAKIKEESVWRVSISSGIFEYERE